MELEIYRHCAIEPTHITAPAAAATPAVAHCGEVLSISDTRLPAHTIVLVSAADRTAEAAEAATAAAGWAAGRRV